MTQHKCFPKRDFKTTRVMFEDASEADGIFKRIDNTNTTDVPIQSF